MMLYMVVQYTPSGGPLKGGTKLKVTGENLGRTVSQLDVSIGDKKCNVMPEDFIPTVRWECSMFCRSS